MKKAITYQEALDQRKIKKDDYFLIKYPDGRDVLFRIDKAYTGDYVMLGPPTEGKIYLEGRKGYDNLFTLADMQVKKEYFDGRAFEEVHACGLPEEKYEVYSYEELRRILDDDEKRYKHPDDAKMVYALASRCVVLGTTNAAFGVAFVSSDGVDAYWLHYLYGSTNYPTTAVRPEATPKPTLLLEMEGHDGSKENPWVCLAKQGESHEQDTSNKETTGENMADVSKSELMRLIQKIEEDLAELKQYAKNLK